MNGTPRFPRAVTNVTAFLLVAAAVLRAETVPFQCRAGETRTFAVPACAAAIKVDGKLDDAGWKDAAAFTGFSWTGASNALVTTEPTTMRVTFDSGNLYLGFACRAERPDALAAWAPSNGSFDLRDDRLEIYFDSLGTEAAPSHYLIVNARGVYKGLTIGGRMGILIDQWSPRVETVAATVGNEWCVEMRVPLAEMGRTGLAGDLCRISVERMHPGKGSSTLVPLPRGSPLAAHFARLLFAPAGGGLDRVLSPSRGALRVGGWLTGENRVSFKVEGDGTPRHLRVEAANLVGDSVASTTTRRVEVLDPEKPVELVYSVLGKRGEKVRLSLFDEDRKRPLYSTTCEVEKLHPSRRTYELKDPLFEPLLDRSRPKDPRLSGSVSWLAPIWQPRNVENALRYGWAYSLDEAHEQVKAADLHFLTYANWDDLKNVPSVWKGFSPPGGLLRELAEGARTRGWSTPVMYSTYYGIGVDANGQPGGQHGVGYGYLMDPVNAKAFADSIEHIVRLYGKDMCYVSLGDEQFGQNYQHFTAQCRSLGAQYVTNRYLKACADEIKSRYGGGRFGIEQALDEKDPNHRYGRAALIRWMHDRLRAANVEVHARVKAVDPKMPILGDDCMSEGFEEYAAFSDYADITTMQLISPFTRRMQRWTCRVKLLHDLGGVEHVAPLLHEAVDGLYSGSCQPEEIVELFSQVMRGGATSVSVYPHSWGGPEEPSPDAYNVMIGYPSGWQLARDLAKTIHDLPRLKFPEPDSAIWYSENGATYARDDRYPVWGWMDRYDHLFTHLGVEARGWFRFVSDNTVKRGREPLDRFRVVYVPELKYSDAEVIAKLTAYAQGGGTVVVLDPDALTFDLLGNSLKAEAENLLGVAVRGKASPRTVTFEGKAGGGQPLPVPCREAKVIEPLVPEAHAVAKFDDGRPAVVERKLGKGRVISFSFLPVNFATLGSPEWVRFWTEYHQQMGGKVGHDIWRFKLPTPAYVLPVAPSAPKNLCLTGNWGFWMQHHFYPGDERFNATIPGGYMIRVGNEDARGPWVFGEGRLTDRLKAARIAKEIKASSIRDRSTSADRVETFKGPEPVEVTFTFAKPCVPQQLKIFFKGEINGVEVSALAEGKGWETLAASTPPARTGEFEVRALALDLKAPSAPATQVRLRFPARAAPGAFTLAEVEIWGECPGLPRSAEAAVAISSP